MSFMDDMREKHSEEYIQKEQQSKIAQKGDYFIYGALWAIRHGVNNNYDKHYLEGYVGKDVGYDYREHYIIPRENRDKEARATNNDIYIIEDEPDVIDYILKTLPVEIRKLGINDFSISHELVQKKERNVRDLLSWSKYRNVGKPGFAFYLKLRW